MTLLDRIDSDYNQAFKNREIERTNTLRLLRSALKNEAIKIGGLGTVLTDEQVMAVLSREIKQRNDSITQYRAANRDDLATKEEAERDVMQSYLPQGLSDSELDNLVTQVISQTGATQVSDMGRVMSELKEKLANPTDIPRAAALVRQKLS